MCSSESYDGQLLHQAVIYDKDDLLNELLNDGGNGSVKSRDRLGGTPLHTAASHGSDRCVKLLLQRGADPNAYSGIDDNCSVSIRAVFTSQSKHCPGMSTDSFPQVENSLKHWGTYTFVTPVHHAAKQGHYDCLVALLGYHEVNLDLKNHKGQNALDLAQEESTKECLKCANYITKVKEERQKEFEKAKREELYDAINNGQCEKVKQILESMPDPYSIINQYYRGPNTLLYRASTNGFVNIIHVFINYKADGRANADNGITPLYGAALAGHLEAVKLLSRVYPEHLVMPETIDKMYPLHAAVMKGHVKVVRYLLTLRGHDVDEVDEKEINKRKSSQQEVSSNKLAVKRRHLTTSDLPADEEKKYYVDVNQPMKTGYTPLHLAIMYGSKEMTQCLLQCTPLVTENMASSSPRGSLILDPVANKMTPFHHALLLGKLELAELLIQHGADLSQPIDEDDIQSTPLQYVCHNSSEEMVKVLLSHGARDTENIARIQSSNSNKENMVQILLNNGVFPDDEGKVTCAANELSLDVKPVIVQWENHALDNLKEEWLLNAGISCNLHIEDKLVNDPSLRIKLFTHINLSSNKLETVPIILFQMPSLKFLDISKNKLTTLPDPTDTVQDAKNSSVVNDTDVSSMLSENWNGPSLEELYLQHNCLDCIPKHIFTMPALKFLNFNFNNVKTLPFEMWIAPSLKILWLEHNSIELLPVDINGGYSRGAKQDTKKDVNNNKTTPNTANNNNRVQTDPGKSDFATVSQIYSKRPTWNDAEEEDDEEDGEMEFMEKSGLNKLDLSDNQLTYIPIGLSCLAPNLSKLILRKNKITEVTSIISFPENITNIDLSDNNLKHFNLSDHNEENAGTCYALVKRQSYQRIQSSSLKKRFCQHCKHRQLNHLTQLILNHNELETVPLLTSHDDPAKQQMLFPALITLDLTKNEISNIPNGIGKLSKLCSFYVSHNSSIDVLPYELGLCSDLCELKLEGLQLKDPPKNVLEKQLGDGRRDIRTLTGYLKSLHDRAEIYPNIKLMIVGIHGIEKTTLLDLLRKEGTGPYQQHDHKGHFSERITEKAHNKVSTNRSTVGVDVCEWKYGKRGNKKIKFSTWDFAGQTEYYATHQCFLSRRAIYLVMWKLTNGKRGITEIETWLLNIQARAPNSAVLIIGTFLDEVDKKRKDEMHNEIMRKFVSIRNGGGVNDLVEKGLPNVINVIEVSCKNGTNINTLRDLIYNTVLNLKADGKEGMNTLLLDKPIPASYIAVEKAITTICRKMKNEMPVLQRQQFKHQIYEQLRSQGSELRNGNEELDQAVEFLHNYGTLLHYDDPSLCNLYFIDPQWLCDLLAHVVTVRSVNPCIKNGVLKISDLQNQIFKGEKRFPSTMTMKYVELMNKFEVAIKISDKFLLIPSLLPDKQKRCLVVADHGSEELRKAMNIHAYLEHSVHRRQYLMSYVPSGFWARLLTRLIADDRICKIVSSCYVIKGSGELNSEQAKQDADTLMRAAPPEWACWKTGIELSCFGAKLLRVSQLERDVPFYGAKKGDTKSVYVKNQTGELEKTVVEILAPSLTLTIEKFIQYKYKEDGSKEDENLVGFRVVDISNVTTRAATQLLVIAIEHIDNLFSEWFPDIDTLDCQGYKSICRVSFCNQCLEEEIQKQAEIALNVSSIQDENIKGIVCGKSVVQHDSELTIYHPDEIEKNNITSQPSIPQREPNESQSEFYISMVDEIDVAVTQTHNIDTTDSSTQVIKPEYVSNEEWQVLKELRQLADGYIMAFELQEGSKLLLENRPLVCPFHQKLDYKNVFPDLCYLDLDDDLILTPDRIKQGEFIASGAYGDVFRADIRRHGDEEDWIQAAMKIPFNSDKDKSKAVIMATMFSYDTYKNVRQELAILVPVNHKHIVSFLGVALSPFAMMLELAPAGALDNKYMEYRNAGKKLNPFVIQKTLIQISAALKYLHRHHIIYRDLKCENILVWSFPGPAVVNPQHSTVLLKLTDYGISRSVSLGGIKGYQGTPGFMAPEIIRYTGKESYTDKVDCFSFGSLIYELLAQKQPYSDLAHMKAANLALQYISQGKRPRLSYREKRFPVLILSLMYRCWEHNADDRPTMMDINSLASTKELPKVLDVLGLGESFNVQCVVTTNHGQIKHDVVDSRSVVGSHLWFCGYTGFGDTIAARREGMITVFSYHESKYSHVVNILIKDRVRTICSVGSTVWLGTESGLIQVFCALTFKPIAIGRLICHRHILRILHSPVTYSVLITRSDGCVYAYHDDISSYTTYIQPLEVQNYFTTVTSGQDIRELFPNKEYTGDTKIHCFAAVSSHMQRRYSQEVMTYKDAGGAGIAVATRDTDDSNYFEPENIKTSEITYELWCGQEKGCITILDLNTLKRMKTIPVKGTDIKNPALRDLHVTHMETVRSYDSSSSVSIDTSMSVWMVVYPGTEVLRWNVDSRRLEGVFDASQHPPWRDLNSVRSSKKTKSLKASDAQISSLVIVENHMYVGTTFGCLLICDAITMTPMLSLRCYEELVDAIIPLRMITSRNRHENEKKLVLTCGRKCLDSRKKGVIDKEITILTWNNEKII